jgi:predicted Rossmann-fold nucleotide-binding protein
MKCARCASRWNTPRRSWFCGIGASDRLQQTRKAPPVPIVLFDRAYWRQVVNFEALIETDMVAAEHRDLFEFADTPEEAWQSIERRGLKAHPSS